MRPLTSPAQVDAGFAVILAGVDLLGERAVEEGEHVGEIDAMFDESWTSSCCRPTRRRPLRPKCSGPGVSVNTLCGYGERRRFGGGWRPNALLKKSTMVDVQPFPALEVLLMFAHSSSFRRPFSLGVPEVLRLGGWLKPPLRQAADAAVAKRLTPCTADRPRGATQGGDARNGAEP